MPQILTITPNPALDLSTSADGVRPGIKLRCERIVSEPGGGGVNVSRAISILGGRSLVVLALGGHTGKQISDMLTGEGLTHCVFELAAGTRENLVVKDRDNGDQYRFVMPGPAWTEADENRFLQMISGLLRGGETLVLSGSLPDGMSMGFPARMADLGATVNARLVIDTSGPAQAHAATHPAGCWAMRMDAHEAEQLAGHKLPSRPDTAAFARLLAQRGVAEVVLISRGEDGTVLATPDICLHAVCPADKVVSKVGAGDSLVGAFVLASSRGENLGAALSAGVAAASSAVMTDATKLCEVSEYDRLLDRVELTQL